MFSQAFKLFDEGLSATRAYVQMSDAAKALSTCQVDGLPQNVAERVNFLRSEQLSSASWRILDHCLAVSRGYALYEQMIERLLADWLSCLLEGAVLSDLPAAVQTSYRNGLGEMLRMIEHDRFEHITLPNVIANYDRALRNKSFDLTPEILTFHQRNLRMSELNDLLLKAGIGAINQWVEGSSALKTYFGEKSRTYDLVESRLTEFVKYRNDAAHGITRVDSILGTEKISEEFDFLAELSRSIFEFVSHNWIDNRLERGKVHFFGQNTKNYQGNVAIIACEAVDLRVGETIAVRGPSFCKFLEIISMQVEDEDVERLTVANPKLVGFKLTTPIPMRGEVFKVYEP